MLLIGSRHRRDSCSEAYRFARSGRVAVDPKIDLDVSGLLSWGSSIAPPSTQPSLRRHPPGPSPRLRIGTATSRSCSAPAVPPGFSGLLRSEQIRRSARSMVRGFVAPRSRPWGSPRFGLPDSASQPSLRPEGRGPEGPGIVPCGEDPSKRSPPRQPSTMPSPRLVLSDAVAYTGWRSLSPLEPRSLPCHHGAMHCSRPQGFLPPRSPLRSRDVAVARRSMLPWALDRLVPDAAARIALPSSRWTFRLAARTASASPHPNVKGRQGVSALSGSLRSASGCPRRDDRARSRWLRRVSRRSRLGRIPDGPRRGCQWICPERRSTASVRTPEGIRFPTSSRRISEETRSRPSARSEERRPVVRAPSLRPSAVARVHDGETARRGRAHPEA
jgi:hypothetical protein